MHQPLHAADRGGNAEHVSYFGTGLVLLGIWDNQVVAKVDALDTTLAAALAAAIGQAAGAAIPGCGGTVVRLQIARAGVRLAAALQTALP